MPINPTIALGFVPPQVDDPLTTRTKQLQLSDLMGRQQAQQLQLGEAQRGIREQQTLADLYRQHGSDPAALIQGMAQSGLGARIPAFQKQQAEATKATTDNDLSKFKLMKEKTDYMNAGMSALLSDPELSHEKVIGFLGSLVTKGAIPADEGAAIARSLPGDVPRLRQMLTEKALQGLDASQRLDKLIPKTEMRNLGGTDQQFQTNPLTGQVTPGPAFAKTATPEAVMTDERTRSEGAANRGVTMRGQDLTYKSAQEARDAAKEKLDLKNVKVTDATEALALIDQAEPILKSATGSYGGLAMDKIAQAFGYATPGSINAQKLKAIEGALIAKMPKMSGPQSDKDVLLYKQMAGQIGDETIPYERKIAALNEVKAIQQRYAGVDGAAKTAAPPVLPKAGAVDGGYVFLGGDPADPSRWKKK